MTSGFHKRDWTDQEVGYALARAVPIIAMRLERDPYGFLGKFQALTSDRELAPEEIVKLLIKNDRMLSAYISVRTRSMVARVGDEAAKGSEHIVVGVGPRRHGVRVC